MSAAVDFPSVFADFYRATAAAVHRSARRWADDRQCAEDAVQEAYLRILDAWPHRQHFTNDENRRYTTAIVHHLIVDWYRHHRRWTELEDVWDAGHTDPALVAVLDHHSVLGAIRDQVRLLPPRCRAVAVLRFYEDRDYAEIAEELGMTESTVRSHVEKARALLKPHVRRLAELDSGKGGTL